MIVFRAGQRFLFLVNAPLTLPSNKATKKVKKFLRLVAQETQKLLAPAVYRLVAREWSCAEITRKNQLVCLINIATQAWSEKEFHALRYAILFRQVYVVLGLSDRAQHPCIASVETA